MKRLLIVILFLASLPASAARATDDARHLLRTGKYAEAAALFAEKAKDNPAAAVGLARCLAAQGKTAEADRALVACPAADASLEAERARLAVARGDYAAADARVAAALKLDTNELLARWLQGELHRTAGRLDEAEASYRWLVEHYNANDVTDAESLRWIGLAAAHYARWNRLGEQFSFLVNELYPDALKREADYWPAHYEAGLLFLEKYNTADAARELKAALAINPNAAEVHAALGQLYLAEHDVAAAQASIDRAVELDPALPAAWHGKADLLWANFQPEETAALLEKTVLPLNPLDEETLGRLAACRVLSRGLPKPGDDGPLSRMLDEVNRRNPHAGVFYLTLGGLLDERNKIAEAERFYVEARRRMPKLLGPQSRLGMLWMRAGREEEARKLLDEAFDADPFNVRVSNTLSLFKVLDAMATVDAGGLVLKFDAKRDRLLGRYVANRMGLIYRELCRQFGYTPPEKPMIEIFNEAQGAPGHAWFSTRMTGLPYLGTVAACSGRVVAMTSPGDKAVAGKFNWARVLKHELVHVITLDQTKFNIPHWYTEGLAVHAEDTPRPASWNELLRRRVPKGELFTLDTINFGFTRPDSSDEWQMAYCQAELYVDYILDRHSPEALGKLLAAYADGLTTRQAIPRALGTSQEEFERGYVAYLQQLVSRYSGAEEFGQRWSFDELLKQHRAKPEDVEVAAELAYAYLQRGAYDESRGLAEEVAKRQPKHALAGYVLARLHLRAAETDRAVALLEGCLDAERPQPDVVELLAGLKVRAKNYDEAARLYLLAKRHDPENVKWAQSLARVYLLTGDEAKLASELTQIAQNDADDLIARKKLAQMALAGGDYPAACRWAGECLDIDVSDPALHGVFAEALLGCHNHAKAVEEFDAAIELAPDEPRFRLGLAAAYLEAGRGDAAREPVAPLLKGE
ncbi:MAG: tetratricopeptide repeat protein [Planctomycetia bacterium]|nr:tetratricopeptide repeat protein [Planctomycetia bacterium]